MATTPEGKVKAKVKKILEKYNVYYTMPATHGYGRSGVADFICCANGKFIVIECKAGGNKLTALQEREGDKVINASGMFLVITEDNVDNLEVHLLHVGFIGLLNPYKD